MLLLGPSAQFDSHQRLTGVERRLAFNVITPVTESDTFRAVTMAMSMIKQNMARKAEKALKEVLNKADSNLNGKVALSEFVLILEANGVEVRDHYC